MRSYIKVTGRSSRNRDWLKKRILQEQGPAFDGGYQQRDEVLLDLGFESYKAYLASDLWIGIRRIVMEENPNCAICLRKSTQVHHMSYVRDVLVGTNRTELKAVCFGCHRKIEFYANGRKRPFGETRHQFSRLLKKAEKQRKRAEKRGKNHKSGWRAVLASGWDKRRRDDD